MPQISIIVPVYKAEQFLEKCIHSILNQSFTDLELILVDDGSPDSSPAMCDAFAALDSRVYVIHQKNAGVAAARNAGLKKAQGEYVTFVDSDDFIETEMYASMMDIARQYDCDVVMCDCVKEYHEHTELYTHDIRQGYYDRKQLETEYFPHLLIMPNVEYPPTISNCLCLCRYRRGQNNRERLQYEEGIRYSEDLLFGAQMMFQAQSFYYMKERIFYHYNCRNQQSATHKFAPDKWMDYQKLHKRIQGLFGNCEVFNFSEQIDKVLLFFVYNAVGDLRRTVELNHITKVRQIKKILKEQTVREMFHRIRIRNLPVPIKLKVLTACYKYGIGIGLLCEHERGKK